MDNSILTDIKKLLGLPAEYDVFDQDIILHINSVFFKLRQLGVGPEKAFSITDDKTQWSDFSTEMVDYEAIKTYIYMNVRLIFDPPQNSFVVNALQDQIKEYEWRLLTEGSLRNTTTSDDSEAEHV
jgi:hypothetical protein